EGRANFLAGQISINGWWYYFIVAFFIKTPIPTLLVILFSLIRWPWKKEWRESIVLAAPALFFFGGASISKLQLGYRYILPVLPFLFLIAARALSVILSKVKNLYQLGQRLSAWLRVTFTGLLAAWLAIGTLAIFPHYLSYFNESIGGAANGYNYLVDSNLDWGQDLPALKDWIDQHPAANLHLGFFGVAYPDRYGVQAIGLPGVPLNEIGHEIDGFTSYSLEPGLYALSATLLRVGLVFKQFNLYQNFESMTPIDRAGYSILIYDVKYPSDAQIDRAVVVGPLTSDALPADLGYHPNQPLRAKWCDPKQCFIFTPHPARYLSLNFIPFDGQLSVQANGLAIGVASPMSSYRVFDLDATSLIHNKLSSLQKSVI
ncbi:MAG TPA: hypothetical protein VFK30_00775, partial [Anaerolineae bacterium]|nr:hypothetical protein [Anaerolineae bacterium]